MLVNMWMTREVVTVAPQTLVSEAAAMMANRSIRRLLVTEDGTPASRILGIASSLDLAGAYPADRNPFAPPNGGQPVRKAISEVMTAKVHTVEPDTPVEEAARVLRDRKIGALPVVREERLVGIITESDIFRAFLEVVGVDEGGIRVMFELSSTEEVVGSMLALGRKHGLEVASTLSMQHDGKRLGVARLHGPDRGFEGFIGELWRSGHRVLSVERVGFAPERPQRFPVTTSP